MRCPRCDSDRLQVITETTSNYKGYGLGKGCLGRLVLGPIGWLCGLCGMGRERTKSKSYWICHGCGHKFKA